MPAVLSFHLAVGNMHWRWITPSPAPVPSCPPTLDPTANYPTSLPQAASLPGSLLEACARQAGQASEASLAVRALQRSMSGGLPACCPTTHPSSFCPIGVGKTQASGAGLPVLVVAPDRHFPRDSRLMLVHARYMGSRPLPPICQEGRGATIRLEPGRDVAPPSYRDPPHYVSITPIARPGPGHVGPQPYVCDIQVCKEYGPYRPRG